MVTRLKLQPKAAVPGTVCASASLSFSQVLTLRFFDFHGGRAGRGLDGLQVSCICRRRGCAAHCSRPRGLSPTGKKVRTEWLTCPIQCVTAVQYCGAALGKVTAIATFQEQAVVGTSCQLTIHSQYLRSCPALRVHMGGKRERENAMVGHVDSRKGVGARA